MVVSVGNRKDHHFCFCCIYKTTDYVNCDKKCTEFIPHFYSHQHALDSGWGYTNDPQYSNPDGPASYICPDCMDKLGLKQASI